MKNKTEKPGPLQTPLGAAGNAAECFVGEMKKKSRWSGAPTTPQGGLLVSIMESWTRDTRSY